MRSELDFSTDSGGFAPGFRSFPYDSQKVFRLALNAMAHPATVFEGDFAALFAAPPPLFPEGAALLLTLCDYETGIHLSRSLKRAEPWLSFHAGSGMTDPREAAFAAFEDISELPPLREFRWGDERSPELSAILIAGKVLDEDAPKNRPDGKRLFASGPGIEFPKAMPGTLPEAFVGEREDMRKRFPLGVDFFFTGKNKIMGLPRTTRLWYG
ncbi:MAG: phosphonate C-P lyase system protein PhnH [Deltaproteobacteria bacterium]|jgi:alpha-D-ribose 1-methylphosphonate 5-triphosphate synthase subunit PhnH|nr:phosphonate C-P lyase system protein PhnH [Deltaproteobacteria bacterium]